MPPGASYDACCGPLHRQERDAGTPEQLMRSRYSAYVLGETNHVFRTWHPGTRPDDLDVAGPEWTRLEILEALADGDLGTVEFVAHYVDGRLHERSRFERRRGRWVYVDGVVKPTGP